MIGSAVASPRIAASLRCAWIVLGCVAGACRSSLSDEKLIEMSRDAERAGPSSARANHAGPGVAQGAQGTARFADEVFATFSPERALAVTAFADGYYREPANDGFNAVIDRVEHDLRETGFGTVDGLEIEIVTTPMKTPAWTPHSARLALVEDGKERVLHSFASPEGCDRTMLPRNAPSADVEGPVVTDLDSVKAGCVLLVDSPLSKSLLEDAHARGAVFVLSCDLADYNVDPVNDGERHLDAIGYRHAPYPSILPVAQVSPRAAGILREAAKRSPGARVKFQCEVAFDERPLRTIVATVVGATKPDDCVTLAAHVQEPGACDNASGVGTLLECARVTATLLASGELSRPARSLCFVFGNEIEQSRIFLEHTQRHCVAGIAADMTGESSAKTGAIALLERSQDPGALKAYPPDRHTAWSHGATSTADADDLVPSGIAVVARCALIDIGMLQSDWITDEHPFEGGSDHVVYLEHKIPAVLFWHFPDFTYHTSLDRLENVDAQEMRRTGGAMLATALAVADPRPVDMERYLKSLEVEWSLRVKACTDAQDEATATAWNEWKKGARLWLRDLCLNVSTDALRPKKQTDKKPTTKKETR